MSEAEISKPVEVPEKELNDSTQGVLVESAPIVVASIVPVVEKLIATENNMVLMVKEGFEKLHDINEPLHLIAVSGSGRIGKSWFMNYVADKFSPGNPVHFKVRSGFVACTTGVDVLLPPMDVSHLDKKVSAKVALLDLEGSGDKGLSLDASILMPAFVSCQIVMFQTKLQVRDSILTELEKFCQPLLHLLMKDGKLDGGHYKLGHFWIICRDCIDDIEEWERYILSFENDVESSASYRDDIRRRLFSMFESVSCYCLPASCENAVFKKYKESTPDLNLATNDWKIAVENLMHKMCIQLHKLPERQGAVVTGSGAAVLWQTIVTASEENKIVDLWEAQAILQCQSIYQEITRAALEGMETRMAEVWKHGFTEIVEEALVGELMQSYTTKAANIFRSDTVAKFKSNIEAEFVPGFRNRIHVHISMQYRKSLESTLECFAVLLTKNKKKGQVVFEDVVDSCETIFQEQMSEVHTGAVLHTVDLEHLRKEFIKTTLSRAGDAIVLGKADGEVLETKRGLAMAQLYVATNNESQAMDILSKTVVPINSCSLLAKFIILLGTADKSLGAKLAPYGELLFGDEFISQNYVIILLLMQYVGEKKNRSEFDRYLACILAFPKPADRAVCFSWYAKKCCDYFADHESGLKYHQLGVECVEDECAALVFTAFYMYWLELENPDFEQAKIIFEQGYQRVENDGKPQYAFSYIMALLRSDQYKEEGENTLERIIVDTNNKGVSDLIAHVAIHFVDTKNADKALKYFGIGAADKFSSSSEKIIIMSRYGDFLSSNGDAVSGELWYKNAINTPGPAQQHSSALQYYANFLMQENRVEDLKEILSDPRNKKSLEGSILGMIGDLLPTSKKSSPSKNIHSASETQKASSPNPIAGNTEAKTDFSDPGMVDWWSLLQERNMANHSPAMATEATTDQRVVHSGISCDGCGMNPLTGTRFKCTVRKNYDLCTNCYERDKSYPMVSFAYPGAEPDYLPPTDDTTNNRSRFLLDSSDDEENETGDEEREAGAPDGFAAWIQKLAAEGDFAPSSQGENYLNELWAKELRLLAEFGYTNEEVLVPLLKEHVGVSAAQGGDYGANATKYSSGLKTVVSILQK